MSDFVCESCTIDVNEDIKTSPRRVRGFELLSENAKMPTRATRKSAGYDFYAAADVEIAPRETKIVPTDVTAYMLEDEFLDIRIRSGLAGKLSLSNGAGVVDSDYYTHNIGFKFTNFTEVPVTVHRGDRVGQGIFCEYRLADEDIVMTEERTGGWGSSGK